MANQYTNLENSTRMSVEKITEKTQAEINKEKEYNNRMYVRIRELERLEGRVPTAFGCLGNFPLHKGEEGYVSYHQKQKELYGFPMHMALMSNRY